MDPRLVLAALLTAAVYAPIGAAPWVYEDGQSVRQAVRWTVPSRALTQATLQTRDPRVAHVGNVAVHLVNGGLLAAVAAVVVPGAAWAVAGVFWLHPLNAEAVAYVSGRSDLLMTSGALLGLVGVLRGGWWSALIPIGVGLAAVSKEIGAVVAVLVALAALWRGRWASAIAVSVLGSVSLLWRWDVVVGWLTLASSHGGSAIGWGAYLEMQATALLGLLRRVLIPTGFTLDHDWLALSTPWAVLGVGGLIAVAVWQRRSIWGLGLAWALVAVAPRFLFRQWEGLHEQHWYLSMAVLCLPLGAGLARLCPERTV
jgi:hypothetical protein